MSRARVVATSSFPFFFILLGALFVAAGLLASASELPRLTSAWRDRDVRVDGVDEEWRDLVVPVKGQRFAVAFLNDAESLYFCLVTKDEMAIRQISRVGLILWLDPAGGKKKTFGIRFPAGDLRPGRSRPPAPGPEAGQGGPATGARQAAAIVQGDVDVLGPGRNDVRQVENGTSGMAARYSVRPDLLIYELKVPLRKGDAAPFAPGVDPGAALRIELQTPEWRGPMPMRRGVPRVGVGIGGWPGSGIFYPGADMALLKPLDIAADLRLATGPMRPHEPPSR